MSRIKSFVAVFSTGALSLSLLAAGGLVRDIADSVAVGAGETLTIVGAAASHGIVDVAAGGAAVIATRTVTDPVSSCALADDLQNGLALWMDGSKNVILNGDGRVDEWRDVRDSVDAAAADCAYPRAVHVADYYDYFVSTAPVVSSYAAYPGRSFVDFGEFNHNDGSDKSTWLVWKDGAGADKVVKVRSFFAFIRLSGANNTVPVGPMLGLTTAENWYTYNGSQARMIYTKNNAQGVFTNAETRVDGKVVDTRSATWPTGNGFYLFSQVGPYSNGDEQNCDNFGNFQGYHVDDLYQQRGEAKRTSTKYSHGNRLGGPIIGEILCYDRMVTDAERRRIEAYLLNKWKGIAFAGTLKGEGAVEKTDAGKLVLDGASKDFEGVMTVADGTVASDTVAGLPPMKALAGKSAAVTNGTVTLSAGAAGTYTVVGEGELAIGEAGPDVRRIVADGVDLAIRSKATWRTGSSAFYSSAVGLVNASFEAPVMNVSPYYQKVAPAGWTLTSNDGAGAVLANRETANHKTALTGLFPDGDQAYCLAARESYAVKDAEISQNFTVVEEGVYGVRFWYGARNKGDTGVYSSRLQVIVDGTNCVDFTMGYDRRSIAKNSEGAVTQAKLLEYEFPTPTLAPGTHTLAIREKPVAGDSGAAVAIIDNVSIVPLRRGRHVWVPDSSFDSCGALSMGAQDVNTFGINQTGGVLANSAWKGQAGTKTSSNYGITQDSRFWWANGRTNEWTHLAAHRMGFILNDGKLYNDAIVFDAAGTYTFSVRYARTDWGNQSNEFHCHVWLSDAQGTIVNDLGKLTPSSHDLSTYEYVFALETPGTYTLNFEGVDLPASAGSGGNGYGVVLDDATFRYGASGKVPEEMERNGFDVQPLARDGSAEMAFALDQDGLYRMNVQLAGLPVDTASKTGPSHGYDFYPQVADVFFDNVKLGRVVIDSPDEKGFTFRLSAESGNHVLRLDSVAELSAARCRSSLKGLAFERAVNEAAVSETFAETRIELENDAKIRLDFDGELVVNGFKIDGVGKSGTVNAETSPRVLGSGTLKIVSPALQVIIR